ncbi:MAG: SH3 domain-containing protein [Deltaproteobacteria bacterium]|nr:SH3 domain-containing protein [Deltaproteobacteria bacterium]MBT4091435.1 SH3 domain-containing protein [Deltaproteobacteria bacterium]MBT4265685.1 SH3 domain-containing protein [Deltaproteobacteria bacterium]MBT4637694.1 SH3 domain-containing protein [Deltaproteobacteria bacterium]MBT6503744.1 SH3 domain-containing protein [Deltaproteobacteria bacterium]
MELDKCPNCGYPLADHKRPSLKSTTNKYANRLPSSKDESDISNSETLSEKIKNQQATFFTEEFGNKQKPNPVTADGVNYLIGRLKEKRILIPIVAIVILFVTLGAYSLYLSEFVDIIEKIEEPKFPVMVNKNDFKVNVRDAPTTKSNVIGRIEPDGEIRIISKLDKWFKIKFDQNEAYVFSNLFSPGGT